MEKKIILKWTPEGWIANFLDDPEMMNLFGTTILMTAWTARASAGEVIEGIQKANPDHTIIMANQSGMN